MTTIAIAAALVALEHEPGSDVMTCGAGVAAATRSVVSTPVIPCSDAPSRPTPGGERGDKTGLRMPTVKRAS